MVGEDAQYDFNFLKFTEVWFVTQDMVYLGECPCALEKKVYSSAFGWNVLKISVRFISSNVSFKTCVLLFFCFDDLSIGVSGMLKSLTLIVLLSISPCISVSVCLMYQGAPKEMATHSSVLAWRIPGTGEPSRLPSMGSHRVGHDWSDPAAAAACWVHRYLQLLCLHFGLIPSSLCSVLPHLL